MQRYVAVDDCGNIINPLLVDGQVHGGIAQGLGQAMYEGAVYDENGQLLTGSFMDYAIPKATQVPRFETEHTTTPSPVNPLGRQGRGGSGDDCVFTVPCQRRCRCAVTIRGCRHRYADDAESRVASNSGCAVGPALAGRRNRYDCEQF